VRWEVLRIRMLRKERWCQGNGGNERFPMKAEGSGNSECQEKGSREVV
jgi:hypothetical protein